MKKTLTILLMLILGISIIYAKEIKKKVNVFEFGTPTDEYSHSFDENIDIDINMLKDWIDHAQESGAKIINFKYQETPGREIGTIKIFVRRKSLEKS